MTAGPEVSSVPCADSRIPHCPFNGGFKACAYCPNLKGCTWKLSALSFYSCVDPHACKSTANQACREIQKLTTDEISTC